jgi:hypothetical protein
MEGRGADFLTFCLSRPGGGRRGGGVFAASDRDLCMSLGPQEGRTPDLHPWGGGVVFTPTPTSFPPLISI